ncbi:MAG: ABC transporter substrate-binding protein [Thermoleophilaceae bacterium]|nr:ABC transporter substrate-binding protein [Thermoleophilaceae bacterium]
MSLLPMRFNAKSFPALLALLVLAAALVAGSAGATGSKKRVVALTPFSANTLAGVGVKPVAIGAMAIGKKGYSPRLKGVKQLPLSHPNGPNMEQIAQIDPDTVLTSAEWRKGSQTMRDLAINVREMDATTATAVPAKIRAIGYAFGSKKATDKLVAQAKSEYAFATKGTKKSPHPIKQRPKVLMVLGVGRSPYVFLGSSWGGSIAKAAGASLLGGELRGSGGFVKVSDEYVVAQNPDVILAVPHGNAKDLAAIREHLLTNPAWSTTNAVKNGKVFATMDDALLQPNIDVGDTIKRVRIDFLKNW